MSQPRRGSAAPWIVAGAAAVIVMALLLVFFLILRPYRRDHTAGDFSSDESSAITAASTETANVLTYSRAHFAGDFQRALNGSTGSLKTDLNSQKKTTLQTLTTGKFDLSAKETHVAIEGPAPKKAGSGYLLLVTLNGFQSNEPTLPTQPTLEVTVVKVSGKWLVSDIENIGVGS